MRKTLALMACAMVLIASCKKDKKSDVTKDNLVGSYRLTAAVSKLGNDPQEDEYAQMPACEKDDITKLNADMTCNFVDAGTKCVPPGDENGTWSVPSSTQIILDGETLNIKSFDGRTLVVYASLGNGNNTYTYTTTMVKQ